MKIAKKRLQRAVMEFKRRFADYPTKALDELLTEESVSQMVQGETGNYREQSYPPLTTLGLFIGQALSSDGACQDAVARRLSERVAQGATQWPILQSQTASALIAYRAPRRCGGRAP